MQKTTYGLIGYPIGYSFSRKFFTDYFAAEETAGENQYLNFEIESAGEFPDLLERYPTLRGCNVTIPHKSTIIPYLTRLDAAAAEIGAVNTIRVEDDGTTTGFNTDVLGFRTDLRHKLEAYELTRQAHGVASSINSATTHLAGRNTLVLGTGGASKAVVHVLRELGMNPMLVSRTAGEGRITYEELIPEYLQSYNIIVNTTPLGMMPNVDDAPPLPYHALTPAHFVYDLVYNPEETTFMRRARAAGAGAANGLGMLHGQAEASWEIWNTYPEEYQSKQSENSTKD